MRLSAAVIICAYAEERWNQLVGAVASARAQTTPPRELVVVVDGNATLLERAGAELAATVVAANRHAPGISGARNTGVDLTSAPILAFLDDDAVAEADWLDGLLSAYEDPMTLGAGGPVLPRWRVRRPPWFADEFNWVIGCTWPGMEAPDGAIRNPIGANLSVRRDVIAAVGGFQSRFGRRSDGGGTVSGTADETEFCIRALRSYPGGGFRFVPAARVHHHVLPARATWRYYRRRCLMEGAAKALLADVAGTDADLSSERHYVGSVLPRGIWRELRHGGSVGVVRAGSMVAGLAFTATAYLERRLRLRLRHVAGDWRRQR